MTKGQRSDSAEMSASSTVNPSKVRQMSEDDVTTSCQEKVMQVMNCCQDVVRKLDSVHKLLTSDRIRERPMTLEDDRSTTDVVLLQEKLRLSSARINELELVEIKVRKNIEDLEEKVLTLTAQLLVYKEDFDLERKDRELAHGRIAELEQQLMNRRARSGESVAQSSHQRLPHHCLYQSFELVARGHDVCDLYQTDGAPDVDEQQKIKMPTEATKIAEFIDQQNQDPDLSESSMQLVARSFDFHDFFSTVASTKPQVAPTGPLLGCGRAAVARGELMADGAEEPTIRGVTFSDGPSRKNLTQSYRDRGIHCDAFPHDIVKPDFATTEPCSPRAWWPSLSKNPEDFQNFPFSGVNLDETDSSASVIQNGMDSSKLICPKCRRSFALYDHCAFLDHLEEC